MRLNKAQRETMAKVAENIGTLLIGAVFVQELFGKKPIGAWSAVSGVGMAILSYVAAIWLRRKES
ncbi:MAG TPA: hypothetical protein VNI53_09525 [Gammaproteobacteria bacterium]|nr:hypothetical protein [Gammaproteobacteria bacterium]